MLTKRTSIDSCLKSLLAFSLILLGTCTNPGAEQPAADAPNIGLRRGVNAIGNNSQYDMGAFVKGIPTVLVFSIENTGPMDLSVTGLSLTGDSAFNLGHSFTFPFALGGAPTNTANFSIGFNPSAAGTFNAALSVTSNDPDSSVYQVAITASSVDGSAPAAGTNTAVTAQETSAAVA
jgi:hypothetical protein